MERYGVPCIVCNLTKKIEEGKKQETLLNELYFNGIRYINESIKDKTKKIIYHHYDQKRDKTKENFYKNYYNITCPFISQTNLFSFIPNLKNKYNLSLQNGVIRANCIDCLDRTNVFQQIVGISVLIIQLRLLGIDENFPENEKNVYGVLTELYKKMNHEISNQYTGTISLKQNITDKRNLFNKIYETTYEIIIACKRNLVNYFSDQAKQNSMNLFLGKYVVDSGEPFIWDMPSDESLHKKKIEDLPDDWYIQNYEKFKKFNLFKDIEEQKKLENNGKIIYIEKNLYDNTNDLIGINIFEEKNSDMSITSKLIFSSLYKNKKSINDESLISIYSNSDINEYILDYNDYIKYKKEKEDKEEIDFEEDLIYQYVIYSENRDIREFNLKTEKKNTMYQKSEINEKKSYDINKIHSSKYQISSKDNNYNYFLIEKGLSCPTKVIKNNVPISPFSQHSNNYNLQLNCSKLYNNL